MIDQQTVYCEWTAQFRQGKVQGILIWCWIKYQIIAQKFKGRRKHIHPTVAIASSDDRSYVHTATNEMRFPLPSLQSPPARLWRPETPTSSKYSKTRGFQKESGLCAYDPQKSQAYAPTESGLCAFSGAFRREPSQGYAQSQKACAVAREGGRTPRAAHRTGPKPVLVRPMDRSRLLIGCYPLPLDVTAGRVTIGTLPDLKEKVRSIEDYHGTGGELDLRTPTTDAALRRYDEYIHLIRPHFCPTEDSFHRARMPRRR